MFEQIFPFLSFIFYCFLSSICSIVVATKFRSSCKVIHSISFPFNGRSLDKTFFCFSKISDKIDFEVEVERCPQFITSENEKNLNS